MAEFSKIVHRLISKETGVAEREGESNEDHFRRAVPKGYHNLRTDRGGPTFIGVTLSTFREWCLGHGVSLRGSEAGQIAMLRSLSFAEWSRIAKTMFWDPSRADLIEDQRIATMVVDQRWVGGVAMVKAMQRGLGVTADGIVGRNTLAALNSKDRAGTLELLRAAAIKRYNSIVENNPSQRVNLRGWINRVNSI